MKKEGFKMYAENIGKKNKPLPITERVKKGLPIKNDCGCEDDNY